MARINHALSSAVLPTFYRLWLPSLVGLLALSTANIVDGLFIGNYVGATALASVNLIIPFFGILFGFTFMLTMGGAVRAGKYIGEGNHRAASAIFSKTLIAVIVLAALVTAMGLLFETALFRALGGTEAVFPLMQIYFRITLGFVWVQLLVVVMYFFVRIDGYPTLAAVALIIGSAINIGLDYLFIAYFQWGIAGAAWATGISQATPFLVLCSYFFFRHRHLHFHWRQSKWRELFSSAFNGLSEFVNEVSGSIIALLLNWLFMTRFGVEGVAAITVLNYLLVIGMMMVFSIGDAGGVFISQNFGARQLVRIRHFLLISAFNALVIAAISIFLLLAYTEALVSAFLGKDEEVVIALTVELLRLVWPVFAVNGLTIIVTSYLTALHLPIPSSIIAISRGLVLPVLFLFGVFFLLPEQPFLIGIPLAELITFVMAMGLFFYYAPRPQLLDRIDPQRVAADDNLGSDGQGSP